jgi:hypothetical protein
MECGNLLQRWQKPVTFSCPEPDESVNLIKRICEYLLAQYVNTVMEFNVKFERT